MGMTYQVDFMPKAVEDINRLDKAIAQRTLTRIRWLSENFDDITPEVLTGDLKGLLKLRVGSYRVLYTVSPKDKLITIHFIGHRKDIYRTT